MRRSAAALVVLASACCAVLVALAVNAATDGGRWPGMLDLLRRHPWSALSVLTVLAGFLQLVLWWPAAARGRRPTPVSNLPLRNIHFVGREESLAGVGRQLGKRIVTVEALEGLGGVGKTQLAIEYAHRHARDYDVTWWFVAERADLLRDQFVSFAAALGVSAGDDPVPAVLSHLHRRERWLLIFDNAEEPATLAPFLPGGPGHVIVTSRQRGWGAIGGTIDVDVMSRDESVALLRRRVPGVTAQTADAIADRLGDLPLAIEQASAFLEQTATRPEAYLAGPGEVLLDQGKPISRSSGVADVWDVSLQALRTASPGSAALVQMCSFLGPEPIPEEIVWAAPDVLRSPLVKATDPVGPAVAYSLVRRVGDGFYLHRLTAAAIRRKLRGRTRTRYATAAAEVLAELLFATSPADPEYWDRWRRLMPHVLAATQHGPNIAVCRKLLHTAGTFRRWEMQPEAARPLLSRVLELTRSGRDTTPTELAAILTSLGWWSMELGEYAISREMFEESLPLHLEQLGEAHPQVANDMHGLGKALGLGGDGGHRSIDLLRRAVEMTERTTSDDRLRVLGIEVDMYRVLRRVGRDSEAAKVLDRCVARVSEVSDDLTHHEVIDLSHLGWALADNGDFGRARQLWIIVLRVDQATFGNDHPRIASRLTTLARLHRLSGETADARHLYERALAINVATLGSDSPAAAQCRAELARLS